MEIRDPPNPGTRAGAAILCLGPALLQSFLLYLTFSPPVLSSVLFFYSSASSDLLCMSVSFWTFDNQTNPSSQIHHWFSPVTSSLLVPTSIFLGKSQLGSGVYYLPNQLWLGCHTIHGWVVPGTTQGDWDAEAFQCSLLLVLMSR